MFILLSPKGEVNNVNTKYPKRDVTNICIVYVRDSERILSIILHTRWNYCISNAHGVQFHVYLK